MSPQSSNFQLGNGHETQIKIILLRFAVAGMALCFCSIQMSAGLNPCHSGVIKVVFITKDERTFWPTLVDMGVNVLISNMG